MSRWVYFLIRATERLWVRTALFCGIALTAAGLGLVFGPYVPRGIATRFGGEAVHQLLSILSSSMLVIATFSLGTMVSAHNAAASNATPRAAPLLVKDDYAQNALSTFVGVFVYSVTALVALDAGAFEPGGRAVLFSVTIGILALVVITLIRWLDELSHLGQMHDTLDMIGSATERAMDSQHKATHRLGRSYTDLPDGHDVEAERVGYVQTIDFEALGSAIKGTDALVYITCQAGTFVHRHKPLCRVANLSEEQLADLAKGIRGAFLMGPRRTMLQDPRFGLIAFAEVAARALSPGVNDPGTAIDAMVSATRVLDHWHQSCQTDEADEADEADKNRRFEWLFINPLAPDEMIESSFLPIIRYGTGDASVMLCLLRSLEAIAALDSQYWRVTLRLATMVKDESLKVLTIPSEREAVQQRFQAFMDAH